jgi:hypothetical protein
MQVVPPVDTTETVFARDRGVPVESVTMTARLKLLPAV